MKAKKVKERLKYHKRAFGSVVWFRGLLVLGGADHDGGEK